MMAIDGGDDDDGDDGGDDAWIVADEVVIIGKVKSQTPKVRLPASFCNLCSMDSMDSMDIPQPDDAAWATCEM